MEISTFKHKVYKLSGLSLIYLGFLVWAFGPVYADSSNWWNREWSYRKPITVTNSGGSALTDFQVKVTTGTFGAEKIEDDGADLRFVDAGNNLEPHWIESGTGTASREVWVKLSYIPVGGSTIYMYYGNSEVGSKSDGEGAFEFFDDFSTDTIGNYTIVDEGASSGPSAWSVDTGNGWIQQTANIHSNHGSDNPLMPGTFVLANNAPSLGDYIFEAKIRSTDDDGFGLMFRYVDQNNYYRFAWWNNGREPNNGKKIDQVSSGAWSNLTSDAILYTSGQWYDAKIVAAGNSLNVYIDNMVTPVLTTTGSGPTSGKVALYTHANQNGHFDNVRIRKYAATEPTAGTPGSEDSGPSVSAKATLGSGTKGAGPVGYWGFDGTGGPTAYDMSGNSNNGSLDAGASGSNTVVGQMWTPEGKFGGCLEFDGTNDKVSVSSGDFALTTALTLSAWIYPASTALGDIISNTSAWDYRIHTTSGNLIMQVSLDDGNTGYHTASNVISPGTWQHVVGVFNGSRVKMYVNGNEVKDDSAIGSIQTPGSGIVIGSYGSGEYFDGKIDEVKVYSRALSPEEVLQEYNAGSVVHVGGEAASYDPWGGNPPIAWWQFDEYTGSTAYDRSGNDNDGTLQNDTTWAHGKYGSALYFDGDGDSVNIPLSASLPTGFVNSGEWTFVAWGLRDSTAPASSNIFWGSGHKPRINWGGSLGLYGIVDTVYTGILSTSKPADNEFHHVAFVQSASGNITQIYVDGVLKAETTFVSIDSGASSYKLSSGGNPAQEVWKGKIDEVKIYNYARTQAQIAWDYNRGKPIAHWTFDEGAGITANDSSGKGNPGTLTDMDPATDWVSGKYGYCLDFDGSNDYVQVTTSDALNLDQNFTFSAWIYINSADLTEGKGIFMRSNGAGANELNFSVEANEKSGVLIDDTLYQPTGTLSLQTWVHVAATREGGTLKFYINGKLDTTTTGVTQTTDFGSCNALFIGTDVDSGCTGTLGNYWPGRIDDARIYNYARTAEQVKQDYLGGAAARLGSD